MGTPEIKSIDILQNGVFRIRCTGHGGWSGSKLGSANSGASGGSGATLLVDMFLKKGTYYYYGSPSIELQYTDTPYNSWVGTDNQGVNKYICVTGGGAGHASRTPGSAGKYFEPQNPFNYCKIIEAKNGNPGKSGELTVNPSGGASVDPEYGLGAGGSYYDIIRHPGNPGRIVITYLRRNR